MTDPRLARIEAVQNAARRIADPTDALGQEARELFRATGLSPEGVDFALEHCLEHRAGRAVWSQLIKARPAVARAHVLLSANVFTAAFRAIALALVQSPRVFVRASRRAPEMPRLLHRASAGAFELVDTLAPEPGDPLWAYGSSDTLRRVRDTLPGGIRFHAHGSGMGVAVIGSELPAGGSALEEVADRLARDVIVFDQRGCLSPRCVFVEGSDDYAAALSQALARALSRWQTDVPRGTLSPAERADLLWYRDTMIYAAHAYPAGKGLVVLDPVPDRVIVPPVGRLLHVTRTGDAEGLLRRIGDRVTSVGIAGYETLEGRLRTSLGERRYGPLGSMQTPPLDGPVDLRRGWEAEVL